MGTVAGALVLKAMYHAMGIWGVVVPVGLILGACAIIRIRDGHRP